MPTTITISNYAFRTQQVTGNDRKKGQIRIPYSTVAETKSLFPKAKKRVKVILRGQPMECAWNPKLGPDRERSGILHIGRQLEFLVQENEVLHVSKTSLGEYTIK